jgi:hypothetical protein
MTASVVICDSRKIILQYFNYWVCGVSCGCIKDIEYFWGSDKTMSGGCKYSNIFVVLVSE